MAYSKACIFSQPWMPRVQHCLAAGWNQDVLRAACYQATRGGTPFLDSAPSGCWSPGVCSPITPVSEASIPRALCAERVHHFLPCVPQLSPCLSLPLTLMSRESCVICPSQNLLLNHSCRDLSPIQGSIYMSRNEDLVSFRSHGSAWLGNSTRGDALVHADSAGEGSS